MSPAHTTEGWTYYERIGVSTRAGAEEIRSAHRSLVAELHPDRRGGMLAPYQAHFDALLAEMNAARDVLLDPIRFR